MSLVHYFYPLHELAFEVLNTDIPVVYTNESIAGPTQQRVFGMEPFIKVHGKMTFTITPVARYSIQGLVTGKKSYNDRWDMLAPYDINLIWGFLAEGNFSGHITFSQPFRSMNYNYYGGPLTQMEVLTHMSNNHIIPADEKILKQIKQIGKGDIVLLEGYLVNVDGKGTDGSWSRWRTSLSRSDKEKDACEILYVEKVSLSQDREGN